ncbi:hypothetical protein D3C72_1941580 [compost metagenome]
MALCLQPMYLYSKTLDRCTRNIGDEIIIAHDLKGQDLKIGDRLKIVAFEKSPEESRGNFVVNGKAFWRGERIFTQVYVCEMRGQYYFVWPEETVDGAQAIEWLQEAR